MVHQATPGAERPRALANFDASYIIRPLALLVNYGVEHTLFDVLKQYIYLASTHTGCPLWNST